MLPTPSTSHVDFERIYEPAEDSYLFLDTLSSASEKAFLQDRFNVPLQQSFENGDRHQIGTTLTSPIVAEVGTGSGIVLAFVTAHTAAIFGRNDILTIGVDANGHGCKATQETVKVATQDQAAEGKSHGYYVGNVVGDLVTPLRAGVVDVLIFNPPYVPTSELPALPASGNNACESTVVPSFEDDSHLLALSYAGGANGMETTRRVLDLLPDTLSSNGVAYILLCAQNKPEMVKEEIRAWGQGWLVETVGSSGKKAGWEKLQIIRIWRDIPPTKLKPR